MRRIGLTGGIGAGKSTVAALLRDRGVTVIDLDALSRAVLDEPGPGLQEAIDRFGPAYVNAQGTMDRAALAALVFSDPEARADLERIVLTRVDEQVKATERAASATGERLIVHDSPLLLDHHRESDYDAVISVLAPREERIRRVMSTRGKNRDYVEAVMAAQISDEERRERSTIIIENDATPEELAARVDQAAAELGL